MTISTDTTPTRRRSARSCLKIRTLEVASLWAGMTLAVPGATGFVALAQRAVIKHEGESRLANGQRKPSVETVGSRADDRHMGSVCVTAVAESCPHAPSREPSRSWVPLRLGRM
jgi:hypothetical protein